MPAGGHTFISLSPKKHRLPEGAFLYKWKTFVKFHALLVNKELLHTKFNNKSSLTIRDKVDRLKASGSLTKE